ncbi:MAG: cytochrome b/b6 domain-containing protein [Rhodocyclaceae bacterium]|nr:cytochrome b/b6 domain-containing protein [Rhodocyclaceae bacterium]
MARTIKLWDLPTRVFHWCLVLCVAGAFATGWIGGTAMAWHGRFGIAVCGLLAFRLVWGFAGSTYARFPQFVRGPATILAYLKGRWHGVGHNPLGALSVLGMLAVLAFQAGTGLAANDDIAFNGPLYDLVSKETSDRLAGLHRLDSWLVLLLVALHLSAIMFYAHVRKDNLVRPMLTGRREAEEGIPDAQGGGAAALLIAAAVGILAAAAAAGAFLPPPPPPSTEQPAF